tara:strand:- start:35241 stop:35750 length:510 start_codon:yes stop_codon:yes gene_type:complete
MARRRRAIKRQIIPDSIYGNVKIARFINMIMLSGKRSIAENILYTGLDGMYNKLKVAGKLTDTEGRTEKDIQVDLFYKVLDNVGPSVEVKSRRIGGATYQIPTSVNSARKEQIAMKWLIKASRNRKEKGFAARLSNEMADAFEAKGSSIRMREDMHKMAEANQAFAHYG